MQNFVKIKSSRFCVVTLSFSDICKSCPNREFLTSQIRLLTLFAKINFSQNFRIYSTSYSDKFLGFVRQSYCVVQNAARLPNDRLPQRQKLNF